MITSHTQRLRVLAGKETAASKRENADPAKVAKMVLRSSLVALKAAGLDAKQISPTQIRIHGDDSYVDVVFKTNKNQKYGRG